MPRRALSRLKSGGCEAVGKRLPDFALNPGRRFRRIRAVRICDRLPPVATTGLFLKKGRLSSSRLVDRTSSAAPGRLDAHLFLGGRRTPCRWELSRLLNSITGRQAAKAKRELAGTEVPLVQRAAGLKGSIRARPAGRPRLPPRRAAVSPTC